MRNWDGIPWWRQPWWRKALYPIAFIVTIMALVLWRISRLKAIEKAVRDSAPKVEPYSPEKSYEVWRWEKEKREEAIEAAVAQIMEKTSEQVISDFKKAFGRG